MSKSYVFTLAFLLLTLYFFFIGLSSRRAPYAVLAAISLAVASASYELLAPAAFWMMIVSAAYFTRKAKNVRNFSLKFAALSSTGITVSLPYYLNLVGMMLNQPRTIAQVRDVVQPCTLQGGLILGMNPVFDVLYPLLWDYRGSYAYPAPLPFIPELYPESAAFFHLFANILPLGLVPLSIFGFMGALWWTRKAGPASELNTYGVKLWALPILWLIAFYVWPLISYASLMFFGSRYPCCPFSSLYQVTSAVFHLPLIEKYRTSHPSFASSLGSPLPDCSNGCEHFELHRSVSTSVVIDSDV